MPAKAWNASEEATSTQKNVSRLERREKSVMRGSSNALTASVSKRLRSTQCSPTWSTRRHWVTTDV
uniref:Uncharacterized protein n=1 Tax=Cucumis melo TaxID=3656 RepID=A0A9I9D7G1_CUCME